MYAHYIYILLAQQMFTGLTIFFFNRNRAILFFWEGNIALHKYIWFPTLFWTDIIAYMFLFIFVQNTVRHLYLLYKDIPRCYILCLLQIQLYLEIKKYLFFFSQFVLFFSFFSNMESKTFFFSQHTRVKNVAFSFFHCK